MNRADADPCDCTSVSAGRTHQIIGHFLQRNSLVTGVASFLTGENAEFTRLDNHGESV